jgi:hydrogenase maturation factor
MTDKRQTIPIYRKPELLALTGEGTSPIRDTGASVAGPACAFDSAGHCITCSDEALVARVVQVDAASGTAVATFALAAPEDPSADAPAGDATTEVDISLLDSIAPGDLILVHGGVALERADT